ncbi:MAG: hypothetical protein WC322_01555 [Candidatus Paceibacterota bacterium]|jgi:phage terminase small subunit
MAGPLKNVGLTPPKRNSVYEDKFVSLSNITTDRLGDAPAYLDFVESQLWHTFRDEMHWLTTADSTLVEMACKLRAQLITGSLDLSKYTVLKTLIVQLRGGAVTVDRMRAIRHKQDETLADDGLDL